MQWLERKQTEEEQYKVEISNFHTKFFLFFFFFLLTFASSVSAFTTLNIFINDRGEAIFLGETDEDISDLLPGEITILNGEITGITSVLTSKTGDNWKFNFIINDAEINVILPESAIVTSISNGEISVSDNRISVYAVGGMEINYMLEEIIVPAPVPDSRLDVPLLIGMIITLFVLVLIVVIYARKNKSKETIPIQKPQESKKNDLEIIKQVLNDRELLIINKLNEIGKIKGSQLRKLVDIPKASFSRHVQELEKKGLIKRSGEGKNKFIELNK